MAEETTQAPAPAPANNKLMIILIGLIVILILAVGGGVAYYVTTQNSSGDNTQSKNDTKSKSDFEVTGELFKAAVDNQVLNIMTARGKSKLMKLSFTIKSTSPNIQAVLDSNKEEVIDEVIRLITARSAEELQTVGGKELLKEELLQVINTILNQSGAEEYPIDSVKKIFFTSFVIK
jgi:flagellar FliL protein